MNQLCPLGDIDLIQETRRRLTSSAHLETAHVLAQLAIAYELRRIADRMPRRPEWASPLPHDGIDPNQDVRLDRAPATHEGDVDAWNSRLREEYLGKDQGVG